MIVDDHYMIAKLLKMILVAISDISIVGIAKNAEELDQYLGKTDIDVLLLDIDMPQINGLEVLKKIKNDYPMMKVIMLTNHIETLVIKKSISLKADGYITKFSDSDEIFDAIRKVYSGESYLCKTTIKRLMNSIRESEEIGKYNFNRLSKRELEILSFLMENKTSKEIAEKLFLSVRTIETHRKNILEKTGAKSSIELLKIVYESDLLELIKV